MPKNVVSVTMRKDNGWYIATSPDLAGLVVCHQDYVKFVQEIPACIKLLFKADRGMDVDVAAIPSLDDHDMTRVVFEATKKAA